MASANDVIKSVDGGDKASEWANNQATPLADANDSETAHTNSHGGDNKALALMVQPSVDYGE